MGLKEHLYSEADDEDEDDEEGTEEVTVVDAMILALVQFQQVRVCVGPPVRVNNCCSSSLNWMLMNSCVLGDIKL